MCGFIALRVLLDLPTSHSRTLWYIYLFVRIVPLPFGQIYGLPNVGHVTWMLKIQLQQTVKRKFVLFVLTGTSYWTNGRITCEWRRLTADVISPYRIPWVSMVLGYGLSLVFDHFYLYFYPAPFNGFPAIHGKRNIIYGILLKAKTAFRYLYIRVNPCLMK